jgi:hypothetical protein
MCEQVKQILAKYWNLVVKIGDDFIGNVVAKNNYE